MWSSNSNSFLLSMCRTRNRNIFITVTILGVVILCILLSYCIFGSTPLYKAQDTLISVHILFRHGDRSPTLFYPNDPYKHLKYWPEGLGQLNNKGKKLLFEFGKKLRLLYNSFLPATYNQNEFLLRSSYADRCQMSALTLLAGLYPPVGDQIWNDELLWQPIPINSVPREEDDVIVIGKPCNYYDQLKHEVQESILSNFTREQRDLLTYLTLQTGQSVETVADVESLYLTLLVEQEYGLELPKWTKGIFPEKMLPMAELMQASLSWDHRLQRFSSGEMMKEWREHLLAASKGTSQVKMYMYSGHDITITSLQRTLGISKMTLSSYGASIILEFHKLNTNYAIQVLHYDSKFAKYGEKLVLPNCEQPYCSLESFLKIIDPIVPSDWEKECLNPT